MKRPLVIALNPSIDAEWRVEEVLWEEKNVVHSERRWAGGKGVNVARWLKHLGAAPRLLLPLGGAPGRELAAALRAEQLTPRILPLSEATRVNVIVTTHRQGQLRFNPIGPRLTAAEWRAVLAQAARLLPQTSVLVLSGSLPRGVPADAYARLIRLARRAGVPALLDCDGEPLARAVAARPLLVKPNQHELARWRGRPLNGERAVEAAAQALSAATQGWVFLSRGSGQSLLLNASQGVCLRAQPAKVKTVNTVGAGDALLAAVTWQIIQGTPPADWLRAGLAAGTASTQLPAGCLPGKLS